MAACKGCQNLRCITLAHVKLGMVGQMDGVTANALNLLQRDKAVLPTSDKAIWCQEFQLICKGAIFLIGGMFCMDCNGMCLYFQVVDVIHFNSGNASLCFADVFCLCVCIKLQGLF